MEVDKQALVSLFPHATLSPQTDAMYLSCPIPAKTFDAHGQQARLSPTICCVHHALHVSEVPVAEAAYATFPVQITVVRAVQAFVHNRYILHCYYDESRSSKQRMHIQMLRN